MARWAARLLAEVMRVAARSVARTLREEVEESQRAARRLRRLKENEEGGGRGEMSVQEAQLILNVDADAKQHEIDARFRFLHSANCDSLYLRSKVFRAHQRLLRLRRCDADTPSRPPVS